MAWNEMLRAVVAAVTVLTMQTRMYGEPVKYQPQRLTANGYSVHLRDINNNDVACGFITRKQHTRAVIIANENVIPLTKRALEPSKAVAINDNRQVVVIGRHKGHRRTFRWDPAKDADEPTLTALGTLGGSKTVGKSLNDHGDIVGWSMTRHGHKRAFAFMDGAMHFVGRRHPHRDLTSVANDINDRMQIVGWIKEAGDGNPTGFLYENGRLRRMDEVRLTGSNGNNEPITFRNIQRINDRGDFAGKAATSMMQCIGVHYRGSYALRGYPSPGPWLLDMNARGVLLITAGNAVPEPRAVRFWEPGNPHVVVNEYTPDGTQGSAARDNKRLGFTAQAVNAHRDVVSRQNLFLKRIEDVPRTSENETPQRPDDPFRRDKPRRMTFVTHGWRSNATYWVRDAVSTARRILKRRDQLEHWTLMGYDWRLQSGAPKEYSTVISVAGTPYALPEIEGLYNKVLIKPISGGHLEIPEIPFERLPTAAAVEALDRGIKLGKIFAERDLKVLHLISHSAGSWMIFGIAKVMAEHSPDTWVHCTYMDAYVPNVTDLSVAVGAKDTIPLGKYADFAVHYRHPGTMSLARGKLQWVVQGSTGQKLPWCHNVDIRQFEDVPSASSASWSEMHASPHTWYRTQAHKEELGFMISPVLGKRPTHREYPRARSVE